MISRMVTCYELDLDIKKVNMSMFKNVMRSDIVKVGPFSSKAVCSLTIATIGLPDVQRDPDFMSDALSRRMVCVKMDVDPSDPVNMVDLSCACLCVRVKHSRLPISSDNLLITLCGSVYFKTLLLVGEAPMGSVTLQGREILVVLSELLYSTPDKRQMQACFHVMRAGHSHGAHNTRTRLTGRRDFS